MDSFTEKHAKAAFRAAIEQGRIPRYLYKYTNVENCLKIINDGTVYFADYHLFNDPFECKAVIDTNNTIEEWFTFLYNNGCSALEAGGLAQQISANPTWAEREVMKSVLDSQNKTGFLCLTGKRDNLLMWAHYAQQHEGCCVKLDLLNDVDLFFRFKSVEYDDKYPQYNYLRHNGGAFETICHKSKEWEYENEYRIMSFGYIGTKEMKPGTLKDVYLGCRIKECDKRKILTSVATTVKQQGVRVFQTSTDDKSYRLNFSLI